MHAGAPAPACSKELSKGPAVPSRPGGADGRCAAERRSKSGARKGFASCREITDCGTTFGSVRAGAVAVSTGDLFGRRLNAEVRTISSLSDRAASETPAPSASSASSPASRTAVVARMVAMPSRRLSCSARSLSVPAAARTRARSSRSSMATAWNFVRTAGVTRSRPTAASSSRAVRASTEMTSPRWLTRRCFRGAVRRAPFWRWPDRAKDSSSESRGTVAAAACRTVPRTGQGTPRAAGLPGASNPEPARGSPRINAAGLGGGLTRTRSRRWMGW